MAELLEEPMLHRAPARDHLVQVYREPNELAVAAAAYLAAGFDAGEPAVVVVTRAHSPLFRESIVSRGWDPVELEERGMLYLADADDTLTAILDRNGKPSPRLFNEVVGGLLDTACGNVPGRRLRVFGEMVDILCRRGQPEAADALEELWNRLGTRRNFALLCGYKVDVFDRDAEVSLLPQVCRTHSHIQPDIDGDRMHRAVDYALCDVLGKEDAAKVYGLSAKQANGRQIPASQLALMWVSAHMPRSAERILSSARARYAEAAEA